MIALVLAASAAAAPIVLYDLEGDDGGFHAYGDAGQWEWGQVVDDPGSGFDGTRAWTTGRVGPYLNAATDYLEIPLPSLAGLARPMLSFQHWYDTAPGDYGWLEVDTGNGFTPIEPLYGYPLPGGYTGASGRWRTAVFDLSPYGPDPAVRLVFATDLAGVASGWTVDQVALHDGDVAAPLLTGLSALPDTDDLAGPYTVAVRAEDDVGVTELDLVWRVDGVESRIAMTESPDGTWRGNIPAQPPDTAVAYWVEATDGLNPSREPADGAVGFRVYLPAPTALTGPVGRVVDTHATLSWTAPVGRNAVLGYEVLRDGDVVASATDTEADVPLGGRQTFAVRAVYAAGPGDVSTSVTLDAVVPVVSGLAPAEGWPGDTLRVALTGDYLLLVQDDVAVDLGAGLTVAGVSVRDVDAAWLDLLVADDASAGPRTLSLTTDDRTLTLDGAFTVLDEADRPRLVGIDPAYVRQGDVGEIAIETAGGLAGDPEVDLGAGVVVTSVARDGDGTLRVRYSVTGDAPLGERPVTADDGVRLLDGVTLDVRDAYARLPSTCGLPVTTEGLLGTLGMVAAAASAVGARRRR